MSDKKAEENIERYLKTSIYTYTGAYRELLTMLLDDIAAIGRPAGSAGCRNCSCIRDMLEVNIS